MKVQELSNVSKTSGVKEVTDYQIVSDQYTMNLVSNTIYSNKIAAVIRELSTNAWDSHVAAGNTRTPFTVHMPTDLEPYFEIADSGTGMSKDVLVNTYTKYGSSLKRHTDDQQGCMGLGSKSPFAYTNSFTTVSVHNGVKHVYVNAPKENGVNALQHIDTVNTDESNGVSVSFNVDPKDFHKFEREARKIYAHFPVRPNCNVNLDIEDIQYAMESDDNSWAFPAGSSYSRSRDSYVVMGLVKYPIDTHSFADSSETAYNIFKMGFEIRCEMGEVDFDVSRERLSYSPRTIESLCKRATMIFEDVQTIINKKVNSYSNLWEARCNIANEHEFPTQLLGMVMNSHVSNWSHLPLRYLIAVRDVYRDKRTDKIRTKKAKTMMVSPSLCQKHIEGHRLCYLYENDIKGGESRVKKYMEKNRQISNIYLFKFDSEDDKLQFLKSHGMPNDYLIKASSLPASKTSRGKRIPRSKSIVQGYEFKINTLLRATKAEHWHSPKLIDTSVDAAGVYICKTRFNGVADGRDISPGAINKELKTLNSQRAVYGMSASDIKKVEKLPGWISYEEHIAELVDNVVNAQGIEEYLYGNADYEVRKCVLALYKIRNYFPKNKTLVKFVEKWYNVCSSVNHSDGRSVVLSHLLRGAKLIRVKTEYAKKNPKLQELVTISDKLSYAGMDNPIEEGLSKILDSFPLVRMCSNNITNGLTDEEYRAIGEYLNVSS